MIIRLQMSIVHSAITAPKNAFYHRGKWHCWEMLYRMGW